MDIHIPFFFLLELAIFPLPRASCSVPRSSRLPRLLPWRLLRLLLLRRFSRRFGHRSRGVGKSILVRRVVDIDGAAAALSVSLGREELELLVPLDGGGRRACDGRSSETVRAQCSFIVCFGFGGGDEFVQFARLN